MSGMRLVISTPGRRTRSENRRRRDFSIVIPGRREAASYDAQLRI
jgi:hypothetical protein